MAGSVDLSGVYHDYFEKARKAVEEAEGRSDFLQAAAACHKAVKWMTLYAQDHPDAAVRRQRLQTAKAYEERAARLEELAVEKRSRKTSATQADGGSEVGTDDYEAQIMDLLHASSVRWNDIGGLDRTKEEIKMAYALAVAQWPTGITGGGKRNNIMLYGPPGTGKTLLAAATAGSLEAKFFNVKVSSLLSKYFGESTKLISALYNVALRLSPSVIFIDEFESVTPERGSGSDSGPERRIVSTLLAELDGLSSKDDSRFVLTMTATNLPWLLDSAVLSRFKLRIYVPLPDPATRRAILEIQIKRRGFSSEPTYDELVKRTEGFSGREIEQACELAVSRMVREHNPNLLSIVDQGVEAVRKIKIEVVPISQADFDAIIPTIRPVANRAMIEHYEGWAKEIEK